MLENRTASVSHESIERLQQLFVGGNHAHGVSVDQIGEDGQAVKKDGKVQSALKRTVEGPASVEEFEKHLSGTQRLGLVPIRPEDQTLSFAAIESDVYPDHEDFQPIEYWRQRCDDLKIPANVQPTKSGGTAFWFFFRVVRSAAIVRSILKFWCVDVLALPQETEIFPKQDQIHPHLNADGKLEDVGSWIHLPWFGEEVPEVIYADERLDFVLGERVSSPPPPKNHETPFVTLRPDWDPEIELAKAGLKFQKHSRGGKIWFDYHGGSGKCLLKGSAHQQDRNHRQSTFIFDPSTRQFTHTCFADTCKLIERGTEKALAALKIDWKKITLKKGEQYYPPLVVSSSRQLLAKKFRKREALMVTQAHEHPVFHTASINEIHAWRGVGKTNFAIGLCKALATGTKFLAWNAPRPSRVLYIEGELPGEELQGRIRELVGDTENFMLVTPEEQPESTIPSIAIEAGRRLVEEAVVAHKAEVLVIDSISTLANIATNDEEEWLAISGWFKLLRNRYGVAIFYLHHDGKTGAQRGHSKHEDLLDKGVWLHWENGYTGTAGMKCRLEFDKARIPVREDADLLVELTEVNGSLEWTWAARQANAKRTESLEMLKHGVPIRNIAKAQKVSSKTISRWKQEQMDEEDDQPDLEM